MRVKEKVPESTYHLIYRNPEKKKRGEYTWYEARYVPIGDVDNPKMNHWTTPEGGQFYDCFGALDFLQKKRALEAATAARGAGKILPGEYKVSDVRDVVWSDDRTAIIIRTNAGDVEIRVGTPANRF